MRDFLSFRTMITPGLIKVFYILGVIVLFVLPVAALTIVPKHAPGTLAGSSLLGEVNWAWGLLIILLGNIAWRIFCENLILLFSIHQALTERTPPPAARK